MKRKVHEKINELLFWFHVLIVVSGLFLGLFISFKNLIILLVLHRAQFIFLGGCFISKYENKLHGFPKDSGFLQYAVYRFTGKKIDDKQSKILDFFLVATSVGIALVFG